MGNSRQSEQLTEGTVKFVCPISTLVRAIAVTLPRNTLSIVTRELLIRTCTDGMTIVYSRHTSHVSD